MTTISNVVSTTPVPAAVAPAPAPAVAAPSVTVIDAKTARVVDELGRVLTVKRLSAIEKMKLFKALGETTSDRYTGFAVLAVSVRDIDGSPVAFPTSTLTIEALVQRLDDEGLAAAGAGLNAVTPGMGLDRDVVGN